MNKKIFCILVCMLLIVTTVPAIESLKNNTINSTIPSTPRTSMVTNWTEMQKIIASDGTSYDWFGSSVSISGDTALIGAELDCVNGETYSGSAYVFTCTGTTWSQQAKLIASDDTMGDFFGTSVSLCGDIALIGAPGDDNDGANNGSVYVFTRTGTTWTEQTKLIASDGWAWDSFGCSVSLSGDTALIGAYGDGDNGVNSGSAYVFTRTGTTWSQQAKLIALDGAANNRFGISVSLDGDYALIGADGGDNNQYFTGAAYVYKRDDINWTQEAKLLASDGTVDDNFGCSVSLDGNYALIGTVADDTPESDSGSAYTFKRDGTSWTQEAKLLASDGAQDDNFGRCVSLYGNYALISAPMDDDNEVDSGSVYLFTRTGIFWTQQQKLLALDGATDDCFGISVSLSGDTALIGAPDDDGLKGSAYVFTKENQPPNPPTITGPTEGKVGTAYSFNITAIDPDDDEVYCFIDWEDNTTTGWLGPFTSGQQMTVSHTWDKKGAYLIKVKAKDVSELESNWSAPHIFNVYELKKAFLFGRYTNLSGKEGYITFEAVNLRMILFNPFQFIHYIAREKITYLEDTAKALILPRFIIGRVDVVV